MSSSKNIRSLFLKRKPVKVILNLKENEDNYALEISRNIDTTYPHTINLLQEMEKKSIIFSNKEGRKKIYRLTSKGRKIADDLAEVWESMK
jgi:DNA-binding PadR family transcriptional regulator